MREADPVVLVPWETVARDCGMPAAVYSGDDGPPADSVLETIEFYVMPRASRADRALIPQMPRLRVLQTLNAGYDDVIGLLGPKVVLVNGRGLRDVSVSEHALALILAQQREIPKWVRQQAAGQWRRSIPRSLTGSRVLIVGYGSLGAAIERRLSGFDTRITRVATRSRPADAVRGVEDLHELLPEANIVVLTVPLTLHTTVNRSRLNPPS